MRRIAIVGLCAMGCVPQAPAPPDLAAELASLRSAADDYHAAASRKDAAAVVASYAPDAVMVPPGAELVRGLEGVRGYRFGFIETPGVELVFDLARAEVSDSGDLGWTLAMVDITVHRPDGPPQHERVRDFHTWKKQEDGSWMVVVDMWNAGPTS